VTIDRQLRRLSRDVSNPQHDRRHRHGIKSIPVFKAGTVFEFQPEFTVTRDDGRLRVEVAKAWMPGLTCVYNPEALIEASEPCAPKTFREVCIEAGFSNADAFAVDAIEAMITDGVITIEQARKYVRAQLD